MISLVESRAEKLLVFSRRSMVFTLVLIIAVGAFCLAIAIWPFAPGWPRVIVPLTLLAASLMAGLRATLQGERWDPRTAEVQIILRDEWRQSNMNRALRIAFTVVLGAQLPLGWLVASLPSLQAVMAMAVVTTTLGLATVIGLFLVFDRDTDGR